MKANVKMSPRKILLLICLFVLSYQTNSVAQPTKLWERRYDSGEITDKNDFASIAFLVAEAWSKTMKVDDLGNIYITGRTSESAGGSGNISITTIKYDSSGTIKWVNVFNKPGVDIGTGIGIDKDYNVYVSGYTDSSGSYDFVLIKYDSSGAEQWSRIKDFGYSNFDIATAMEVNKNGYVAVTGFGYGSGGLFGTKEDIETVLYNKNGDLLFSKRYNGTGTSGFVEDYAFDIKITNEPIVYITGKSAGAAAANFDCITIKYDSIGVEEWVKRYDGGSGEDKGLAIELDPSENIYVTGKTKGISGNYDLLTVKYDSSGVQKWMTLIDKGGNECGRDLAVFSDGSVCVSGEKDGTGILDFLSIKFKSNGDTSWTRSYEPGSRPYANTIDKNGNLYVCGYDILNDYKTIKYDSTGILLWEISYDGTASLFDEANNIALDSSGNIFVYGTSVGTSTGKDYCLVKYGLTTGISALTQNNGGREQYGDREC